MLFNDVIQAIGLFFECKSSIYSINFYFIFSNEKGSLLLKRAPQIIDHENFTLIVQVVDNQTTAEFWFKPRCFRRHNVACVGNINQLFHRNRI